MGRAIRDLARVLSQLGYKPKVVRGAVLAGEVKNAPLPDSVEIRQLK